MELNIRLEGNTLNQGSPPIPQQRVPDHSQATSVPPQVKQAVSEKTKAEPEKQAVNEQDSLTAIEQANKLMELFNRDLRFEMHRESGVVKISIVSRNDGKVIKQIPPDSVLDMISKVKDMLGSLMDVKA